MKTTDDTNIGNSECDRIAIACLGHLQQEEAVLGTTLERLYEIRKAVLHRDLEALSRAMDSEAATDRAAEDLRATRITLRQNIADALQVTAESATLKLLATHASTDIGNQLAVCRDRLAGMAAEAERVNRANAALLRQSADLIDRLLNGLTGTHDNCQRYAGNGNIRASDRRSIFQEEC